MSSNPTHSITFADCPQYFEDEQSFLEARLHRVEQEISRRRTCSELYQRIWALEKHLQAPDSSSEFSKYEKAISALSDATRRLYYARANRSWFRDLLSSLDLIESIAELEDIVWAHSARVERLKLKLRLSGNKTLDEEYQNLVNSLNRSIQEGISPDRNHEEICALEDERAEIINRLMRTEEGSHFEADSFEVSDIDVSDMHVIDMNAIDMNATEQDLTGKDATDVDATDSDATDFSPPVSELPKNAARRRTVFTDLNYWETLKADLLSAERTLVVVCPYLTVRRTRAYTEIFEELVARNVAVRVITLPSGLLKEHMADQSALVMENLLDLGVEVITVPKIHQKIILVDEKVSWDGSLNWLSHKDTAEHINRSENLEKVAEISESLNIYLKPTESDSDQSMMVTINRFSSDTESGSSIFVQEIVNASSEQLESILFDCDCDCPAGAVFGL